MLTEKSSLFAVLTGAIAPTLPLYTISLGPLYHKILRPPLLKYKLGLAKMKQAGKKKKAICMMTSFYYQNLKSFAFSYKYKGFWTRWDYKIQKDIY